MARLSEKEGDYAVRGHHDKKASRPGRRRTIPITLAIANCESLPAETEQRLENLSSIQRINRQHIENEQAN